MCLFSGEVPRWLQGASWRPPGTEPGNDQQCWAGMDIRDMCATHEFICEEADYIDNYCELCMVSDLGEYSYKPETTVWPAKLPFLAHFRGTLAYL